MRANLCELKCDYALAIKHDDALALSTDYSIKSAREIARVIKIFYFL